MLLTPHIDSSNNVPAYIQLYQYIKQEIILGHISINEKLPSVRVLANHLGLSRTTVENAYQQLLAEGYIYSKPQKGYYVNLIEEGFFVTINKKNATQSLRSFEETDYHYDFKQEYVEDTNFDFHLWKKYINEVINYQKDLLYTYGYPQGEPTLIKQIVKYIHRTRGVNANENNIVVGAGVQPLLNMLSVLLKKLGFNKMAMEEPGFNRAKSIFVDNDFDMFPLEVTDSGINLNDLKEHVKLCYISPSHQFPTGTVMLVDTRLKLIKWAYENKGYIIEDDFNSELRYEGVPIPAMQGLDPHDIVIYLGSFSTVLVPSIRISYMVLPDILMMTYQNEKTSYVQTASKLEQLALAKMMETGDFDRHVRRIKNRYAKKSEYTIKCVQQYLGEFVDIIGTNSGLNILLKLKIKGEENEIIKKLKENSIHIGSVNEYRMNPNLNTMPILILNFRGISSEKILDGIKKMNEVLSEFKPLPVK